MISSGEIIVTLLMMFSYVTVILHLASLPLQVFAVIYAVPFFTALNVALSRVLSIFTTLLSLDLNTHFPQPHPSGSVKLRLPFCPTFSVISV